MCILDKISLKRLLLRMVAIWRCYNAITFQLFFKMFRQERQRNFEWIEYENMYQFPIYANDNLLSGDVSTAHETQKLLLHASVDTTLEQKTKATMCKPTVTSHRQNRSRNHNV